MHIPAQFFLVPTGLCLDRDEAGVGAGDANTGFPVDRWSLLPTCACQSPAAHRSEPCHRVGHKRPKVEAVSSAHKQTCIQKTLT